MKISSDYTTRLRIRESFDFLRVHKHDLSPEQKEQMNTLFCLHRDRGLTESQVQELFELANCFQPVEILRIRKNY